PGFSDPHEVQQQTPFGDPSDAYILGTLEGRQVAFLARHSRGHKLLPSELNFRANIYGFKQLGAERIVSVSAVGSLKEEHRPLDFVIPDQFFDRTRHRVDTFFGEGIVAHVGFGDPVCGEMTNVVHGACQVTVEQIVSVLVKNAENAAKVVKATVSAMPKARTCKCGRALALAIMTDPAKIPTATKQKLGLILGKYLK